MNKKIIIKIIYLISSLTLIIWAFYKENKKQEQENLMFDKEYSKLLIKDSLNSRVIDVFNFSAGSNIKYLYSSAFKLENCLNYSIYSHKCINYPEVYINDIIQKGVLLNKSRGSDTLIVTNDKILYYFLIEESP